MDHGCAAVVSGVSRDVHVYDIMYTLRLQLDEKGIYSFGLAACNQARGRLKLCGISLSGVASEDVRDESELAVWRATRLCRVS